MEGGWVKIYRKIEEWEWYKSPLTAHLFHHLILRANRTGKKWRGYEIPAGCLVTSISHLSEQTGLTVKQVRTALDHLYSSGDVSNVTQNVANKKKANFTILKVENYSLYQSEGKQRANEGQTKGKRRANEGQQTRNKEVKKERNKEKSLGPDGLDEILSDHYSDPEILEAWSAYLNMRRKTHKPVTEERALNALIEALDNLASSDSMKIQIIDRATANCWPFFYPLNKHPNKKNGDPYGKELPDWYGDVSEEPATPEQVEEALKLRDEILRRFGDEQSQPHRTTD